MNALYEFDPRSQTILINAEFSRSEASEGLDIVDPATEDVIGRPAETSTADEALPQAD